MAHALSAVPASVGTAPPLVGQAGALVINTNYMATRTDAELAHYDYILANKDQITGARMNAIRALKPGVKFLCYQNSLFAHATFPSTGISKAELDANPTWQLQTMLTKTYRNSVLGDSPDVFFELQETSGTSAADASGHGYTGTYNAAQTLNQASLTGNAGLKSVSFSGASGMATTYPIVAATQNYTFEGWSVVTSLAAPHGLFGSDGAGGHRIYAEAQTNGAIIFWTDTAGAGVSVSWFNQVTANTIFHWAITWDASTLTAELFINGSSKGTRVLASGIPSGAGNLNLGALAMTWDPLLGRQSHVAVYKSILAEARIATHYANGPTTAAGGGAEIESVLFPGNWLCNPGSSGYQNQWAANVIARLQADGWDGVFADDIDWVVTGHYPTGPVADPAATDQALTDTGFRALTRLFLVNVGPQIRSAGFLWFVNLSNSLDPPTWTDWISLVDGSTREFWKKFSTGDSTGVTPVQPASGNSRFIDGDFLYDQQFFTITLAAGKVLIPIMYGVKTDLVAMEYGRAAFLLDWDGGHSVNVFGLTGDTSDPWRENWGAYLGLPRGAKYTQLSLTDAFRRDFDAGSVIVNANVSSRTFNTSDISNYKKLDGSTVGASVNLAPATALILRAPASPGLQATAASPRTLTATGAP